MGLDLKKSVSVLILFMIISVSGCILDSSDDDNVVYQIGLNYISDEYSGSIDNTTENMNELKEVLSQNGSLEVKKTGDKVLKLMVTNMTSKHLLNFTDDVDMWGNITVTGENILVHSKLQFEKDEEYNMTEENDMTNKTHKAMQKNWNWTIRQVEEIYDVNIRGYWSSTSVATKSSDIWNIPFP